VLASSAARLEHARALVDLGAARRRAGHRVEGRAPLREGLDMAHRCGSQILVDQARMELRASGARPRRDLITGRDALTPAEQRVAALAARGMTNREIAQVLFLSMKTVENHLARVYGKLGISSRDMLAEVTVDAS
jgi:DNA-binding CsgD family transcriptional regulator